MRILFACALWLTGCSGGASPEDGGADLSAPSLQAVIVPAPDLVGFATRLDGSQSSDSAGRTLAFLWHFTAVPSGSAITDANLSPSSRSATVKASGSVASLLLLGVLAALITRRCAARRGPGPWSR